MNWKDRKKLDIKRYPKLEINESTDAYKLLYRLLRQQSSYVQGRDLLYMANHYMCPILYAGPPDLTRSIDIISDISNWKLGPIQFFWDDEEKLWSSFPTHHHLTENKAEGGICFCYLFA